MNNYSKIEKFVFILVIIILIIVIIGGISSKIGESADESSIIEGKVVEIGEKTIKVEYTQRGDTLIEEIKKPILKKYKEGDKIYLKEKDKKISYITPKKIKNLSNICEKILLTIIGIISVIMAAFLVIGPIYLAIASVIKEKNFEIMLIVFPFYIGIGIIVIYPSIVTGIIGLCVAIICPIILPVLAKKRSKKE